MSGCRLLRVLFHAFVDSGLFLLPLCEVAPDLRKKEIDKSGIAAVYNKIALLVLSILTYGDCLRPYFIFTGDTSIPFLFLNCICKNIENPIIAEFI